MKKAQTTPYKYEENMKEADYRRATDVERAAIELYEQIDAQIFYRQTGTSATYDSFGLRDVPTDVLHKIAAHFRDAFYGQRLAVRLGSRPE